MEDHFIASVAAQTLLLQELSFGCTKIVFEAIAAEQPGDQLTGNEHILVLACAQGSSSHITNARATILENMKVRHNPNEKTIVDCAYGKFVDGELSTVVRMHGNEPCGAASAL